MKWPLSKITLSPLKRFLHHFDYHISTIKFVIHLILHHFKSHTSTLNFRRWSALQPPSMNSCWVPRNTCSYPQTPQSQKSTLVLRNPCNSLNTPPLHHSNVQISTHKSTIEMQPPSVPRHSETWRMLNAAGRDRQAIFATFMCFRAFVLFRKVSFSHELPCLTITSGKGWQVMRIYSGAFEGRTRLSGRYWVEMCCSLY